MKKIISGDNLVGFVFLLAIAMFFISLFESCGNSPSVAKNQKAIVKVDTIWALAIMPKGYVIDTAERRIEIKRVLDTAEDRGTWVSDTTFRIRFNSDTQRDMHNKPLFDSLHRPLWKRDWSIWGSSLYIQQISIAGSPLPYKP